MSSKLKFGAGRVAAGVALAVVTVLGVTGASTTTVAGNSSWCC